MLRHMSAQDKICSDINQIDLTLVKFNMLVFGLNTSNQSVNVHVSTKSAWKCQMLFNALHYNTCEHCINIIRLYQLCCKDTMP